ncbi:MAG TPA: Stf0 family sulfotransferase [Chthoniobacterales bacterium]|nr:Stf0 family sulfotransferase [Chthoniobacterales bacterium]
MSSFARLLPHWRRCYMLCAVARSGSNLLADGLVQVRRAGRPGQYFLPQNEVRTALDHGIDPNASFASYIRALVSVAASANGVFGFKIMGWYLEKFVTRMRETGAFGGAELPDVETLRSAFPRLQFVQILRRNKVRQAISKARALQTGLWKIQEGKTPVRQAQFDPQLLARCISDIRREEEIWADFFARSGVTPFRVEYEELCRDYEPTIRGVLDFLKVRLPRRIKISSPVTVSQTDETSREWEERFLAMSSRAPQPQRQVLTTAHV